jgi:hypothetical protein
MFGRSFGVLVVLAVLGLSAITLGATYGGGSGTAGDPYQIWTAEQLNTIGANSSDWDKHFKLMADIDMSAYTEKQYNFIGGYPQFSGTFDGQGYIIRNLSYSNPYRDSAGLFGEISPKGQVRHLGIENIQINARDYVGGVAGYNRGTITSCYVRGTVNGRDFIGGLVGRNNGSLVFCYSEGTVSGTECIGGLAGSVSTQDRYSDEALVRYCYSRSIVQGNSTVGGLVGSVYGGSIRQSYATGAVSGQSYIGGLIGRNGIEVQTKKGIITCCYATGLVSGTTYTGGFVGDNSTGKIVSCFWDVQSSGQTESVGGTGITTSLMQDVNTFTAARWDFSSADGDPADWFMNDTGGPVLSCQEVIVVPDVVGMFLFEAGPLLSGAGAGLNFTLGLEYDDASASGTILNQTPEAGNTVKQGSSIHLVLSCPSQGYSGGSGTATDPYQIGSAEAWVHLSTSSSDWNNNTYFALTSDINFHGATIAPITVYFKEPYAIMPFRGTLDGNGFVMSHAVIDLPGVDVVGLFGSLHGNVRHLGLRDILVTGRNSTGGLAGSAGYSILNCFSDCTVEGSVGTGNLVGSAGEKILNSFAVGSVSGTIDVGGLAGGNGGRLLFSYASGVVRGIDNVGGLVGYNGDSVQWCYAIGSVSGDNGIGGLVGDNHNWIRNCYAAGPVQGVSNVGGLCGLGADSRVKECFWDIETTGQTASAGGIGKTTAQMKSRSTYGVNGWEICEGTNYPRLSERILPADFVCPDGVNLEDIWYLMQRWQKLDCAAANHFCQGADLDESGAVDLADFAVVAEQWLDVNTKFVPPLDLPVAEAWWTMDETEGQIVTDSTGGHHGQTYNIIGNPWTTVYRNNPEQLEDTALQLDGVDDYVNVSDYKGICGTAPRTCAAWIKLDSIGREQVIISWGGNAAGQKWMFRVTADGKLAVGVWGGYIQTTRVLEVDGWYHVAAMMDDDGSPDVSEIKLCINGVPVETVASNTQPVNTALGQDVQMGTFLNGTTQTSFLGGLLDDVRIYDRVLNYDQLRKMFEPWRDL